MNSIAMIWCLPVFQILEETLLGLYLVICKIKFGRRATYTYMICVNANFLHINLLNNPNLQ